MGSMNQDFLLLVRVVFTGLFLFTLGVGFYLMKNFERLFGRDPNLPSENSSARSLNRVQVFSIWAHVLFLTAALALLLH